MKKFRSILFTFSLFLILGGLAYAAPQAPVVTVGVDNLDVTISWDSVEGASGYNVCYSVYPGGTPISCVDVGDVASVAVTLLAGESYYVACQAYDESGASRYSNIEAAITAGPSATSATRALEHMAYISENIGIRVAGSPEEKTTRDYIAGQLMELGLSVSLQKFRFEDGGAFGESFNVVAVIPGASAQQLIVGAHYDSVEVGEGASDNASGVGALLAAAEALIGQTPPYTVVFIAFGAEEIGLKGSRYYASNMAAQDVADTIGMINLDTLVGGDMVYVYGDAGDAGWIRDQALALSPTRTVTLQTNPGLNPDYPAGTTGDWSDHAPFKALGIPHAYFESTNWEIGDLDGYVQTVLFGEIWHTENDTMNFFAANYPGRIEEQMDLLMNVLDQLILSIDPPEAGTPAIREKGPSVRYTTRNGDPL